MHTTPNTTVGEPLPGLIDSPVTGGTAVICDSCNRRIASTPEARDSGLNVPDEDDPNAALLYITRERGVWDVRFVSCLDCGPCGGAATADADEVHALVTFRYNRAVTPHPGALPFVVATAHYAPDVEHAGERPVLEGRYDA